MQKAASLQDRIPAVAELHRFILCARCSGGTAHEGGGCDQSIGSTVSDAIVRSWLWSPLGLGASHWATSEDYCKLLIIAHIHSVVVDSPLGGYTGHRRLYLYLYLTFSTSCSYPQLQHFIFTSSPSAPHHHILTLSTSSSYPHLQHLIRISSPSAPHPLILTFSTSSSQPYLQHIILTSSPSAPHPHILTFSTSSSHPHFQHLILTTSPSAHHPHILTFLQRVTISIFFHHLLHCLSTCIIACCTTP